MPASKPANYLNWSVTTGTKTQPPTGQCQSGWLYGQAPPMDYMNYIHWISDQWIQWLDQVTTPSAQMFSLTASGTIDASAGFDSTYWCAPATSAGMTFTLPASASYPGYVVRVKNTKFSSNWNVNIVVTGTDKVENQTTDVLGQGEYRVYKSDGLGNWFIIAGA